MFRLSLYVVGITAFLAAWAIHRENEKRRPIPAGKAAAMLQRAWQDSHTCA